MFISEKLRIRTGTPLPGVTVLLKGTTIGTSTDLDGRFKFPAAKAGKSMLVFSFIGMKPVEKEITPGKKIVVEMEEETKNIEEVVVNGVFERKANTFTGSVKTISSEELKRVGNSNVLSSLKNP